MSRARIVIFLFLGATFFSFVPGVHAQSAAELQAQIDTNNRQLESLKADIATFQQQLDVLGAKKNTLQSTISSLALSQKQLATQIQITKNKISSANLQIRQLTLSIGDKEASIAADQDAISKALRVIAEGEQIPLVATLVSAGSLGEAWRVTDENGAALGQWLTARPIFQPSLRSLQRQPGARRVAAV